MATNQSIVDVCATDAMRPQAISVLLASGLALGVAFPADAGDTSSQIRGLKSRVTQLEKRVNALAQLERNGIVLVPRAASSGQRRSDGYVQASVSCGPGERVVSGDAEWTAGYASSDRMISSHRSPDGGGWVAEGVSSSGALLTATAYCES